MDDFQNDNGQLDTQGSDNLDTNLEGDNNNLEGVDANLDNTNTDNGGGNDFSDFNIPQEYQERDWAKNFEGKTGDELKNEIFKVLDEKYTNTPVIPETVEEYALNELEFKNEQGEVYYQYPDKVLEHFGNEFKEVGLTKEQAHGLLNKYTQFELEQFEAISNIDDLNKDLDEMFKSNPAQKQTVQGLLKEFLPAEDQEFLQTTAPNYTIQMFYKVAKGLVDKYGYKEGSGGQGGQNNHRMSEADRDKEYNRIVGEMEAMKKRPYTTAEYEALENQLYNLYK